MQIYSIFPKNKNLPSIKSGKCTNLNSFWIINSLFFEKNRTLANIIIHRINMRRFLIYMYTLSSLMICCITLSSCKDKSIKNTLPKNDTDSVQCTNESTHLQDSTIYGISDEFGMSTFTLITNHGDTLFLNRDHNDGSPSIILGDLDYNVHYALTVFDSGHSVGTLINIDQLERFIKHYKLYNGKLLLNNLNDTVTIISLSEQLLEYKDQKGTLHKISR